MKQITIISSGLVALFLALIAGILWYKANDPPISSFDACEKAGYPTQQNFPRTCKAGIKRFVEHTN